MNFSDFKGIGAVAIKNLTKLGFSKPHDLLYRFPLKYIDTTITYEICDLRQDHEFLIEGQVYDVSYRKFGKKILKFKIKDNTGICNVIIFRFYPNQISMLENTNVIRCYGQAKISNGQVQMIHPIWSPVDDSGNSSLKSEIKPIYSIPKVSDKIVANIIKHQLNESINILPESIIYKYGLSSHYDSLLTIHGLKESLDYEAIVKSKNSIKLEEMIAYNIANKKMNIEVSKSISPIIKISTDTKREFYAKLPYNLTKAQERVIRDILSDISSNTTMNRLLQGDVGSGKTIVATIALLAASQSGYQSALIAPTEILAEQHIAFLSNFMSDFNIEVIPLLGKHTKKQSDINLKKIIDNKRCVVVGTHAVFQDKVKFNNLGLVIVDEQHRFGVEQRLSLINKSSNNLAHQLVISATPIPRTLAMALYDDIKLSVIDELPPNRKSITTSVISKTKKHQLIEKVINAIDNGQQVYWVCPRVEESEEQDSIQDVQSLYSDLSNYFDPNKLGLLYGSMKPNEKMTVMDKFKSSDIKLLVATTVIEVGVDVPNASIMIIENAERLGLSQLHQLRGRVGRGAKQSYCILIYSDKISQVGKRRLSLMRDSQDGFYLAEEDLKIRGAGNILGKEQSGISQFTTFSVDEYYDKFSLVNEISEEIYKNHPLVSESLIDRWFSERKSYIDV